MIEVYQIIIVVLFALAISNIIVGVSNDAVNFLNSALGSKAAKFNVIMIMASIGIFLGSIFSNGMMEVARKGLFHPELFYFNEIIIIFMAVMLTNVILLDFFNTFGFPTSTTVSLVFSILGGAIAIALLKVSDSGLAVTDYINTEQAMTIISGILLSVVLAFIVGTFLQWLARVIFSFQFEKTFKYFGAIWGGFTISFIIFFLFIKGLKGSILDHTPIFDWVQSHKLALIGINFIFWTIIFQICISVFKLNILRFVVLVGTLALAMAFAGNDLVNFIGVPLAGYNSFEFWKASGEPATSYLMTELNGKASANSIILIVSAIIMILTLWFSKKAKTVTQTEINLARQDSGYERFGSSQLSRALVRWAVDISKLFGRIMPNSVNKFIEKRFTYLNTKPTGEDAPAYDLIRASVNLLASSILIALGTSYKLPLSTTYVTFIVAMGSSLADKAWGRESAVYRVTGVVSVISGWFFTALVALTIAFILAIVMFFGKFYAMGALILLAVFLIIRSNRIHKKRSEEEKQVLENIKKESSLSQNELFERSLEKIYNVLFSVKEYFKNTHAAFANEERKTLKSEYNKGIEIKKEAKEMKQNIFKTVQKISTENVQAAQYYVQIVDALRDLTNASSFLGERLFQHIDNNHEIFVEEKLAILNKLHNQTNDYINQCIDCFQSKSFSKIENLKEQKTQILGVLEKARIKELALIQKEKTDVISSDLFLNAIAEYKNLVLYFIRVTKAIRRYYLSFTNENEIKN